MLNKIKKLYKEFLFISKKRNRVIKKWNSKKGDSTYRLDYDLNENSLVFDLGGYKGDFTDLIIKKYNCSVFIFEPIKEFANNIKKRFQGNKKVKVFSFALTNRNYIDKMFLSDDGTSAFASNKLPYVDVIYKDVNEFFKDNKITNIDLMKINIEGGEYDLLEHLIKTSNITLIDNIQIQFHNFKMINAKKRMKNILEKLKQTHYLTWKFRPFIWENWKRK